MSNKENLTQENAKPIVIATVNRDLTRDLFKYAKTYNTEYLIFLKFESVKDRLKDSENFGSKFIDLALFYRLNLNLENLPSDVFIVTDNPLDELFHKNCVYLSEELIFDKIDQFSGIKKN